MIGINARIHAGTGYGDIGKPRVYEVGMHRGIDVDQDTVGGESLGAVAGDGIPVIKVTVLLGVEFYSAVVVKTCGNEPI